MTIEEMREHEWDVPWSGGKDSTATILLMLENGIPIRQVNHVRMMWDDETPATLPMMVNFVDEATEKLRQMGLKIVIKPSAQTAKELAEARYYKSRYTEKNGAQYGIMAFMRMACGFSSVKARTSVKMSGEWQMIGYAADEQNRLHHLTEKKQSVLAVLGITEKEAREICAEVGLLSPRYGTAERDGCWFCPNCTKKERERLQREHPELFRKILDMINMLNFPVDEMVDRNSWLKDYARAHPDDWRWKDWKGNKPKGWIDGQTEMEGL